MKTWTMKKKKEAVSPVIATILMVAITVVLAAVLYVMVMGFGGDTTSSPNVDLTKSGDRYYIAINEPVDYDNMEFKVVTTTSGLAVAFSDGVVAYDTTTGLSANSTASAKFVDVGGDDKVTDGDYFTVTGSGTLYVLWINGDSTEGVADIDF
ncbi:MAG: type IV pilin N-terminal domain-containing protein [Euryarchaeota archaeon]|nr:type IV pilin N-terminal domain-containing protein [Euryarchaeota archaeon]